MELLDVMLKRRSVKKYTGEPIPEEKLRYIVQAGFLAPSSRNLKPWKFIVVRDKAVLKQLAGAKAMGGAMLADADAAIVVTADSVLADTWVEDCSIAMTYMHLAAAEQGVGSCWVQYLLRQTVYGREAEEEVRKILSIRIPYRLVGMLALGMPKEEPAPHTLDEIDPDDVTVI